MHSILNEIKPSKKEKKALRSFAKRIMSKIKIPKAKPMLGGSAAKDTFLRGSYDIDIYVRFDMKHYKDQDISKILGKELRKNFSKVETVHGSRDYYKLKIDKYEVEIIPILKIRNASEAVNITDVSPLHVKFVRKHKKLADDIRLAKAFAKANNVYGAESYIKGFSGYVLEILTIYYKGFKNLLKAASKWNEKEVIDYYGKYKRKDIRKSLSRSKLDSPLIVIDPVQPDRNAAAGLSKEMYRRFINLAKSFLKNPSKEFFFKKTMAINFLKDIAGDDALVVVEVTPKKGKRDIIGAKILKVFEFLKKRLELNGFHVLDCDWAWDKKALLWFIVDEKKLPAYKRHFGPPKTAKKRLKSFREKWKNKKMRYENNLAYVTIKREHRTPKELIKSFLSSEYVAEKVKKAKLADLKLMCN